MEVINYLLGYKDLKIIQDPDMFCFSLDSVLLPQFVTLNLNEKKILDIGCGNAPMPLILSTRTSAKIVGVEIQKEIYELAQKTIQINNKEDQISIIHGDIKKLYKTWESDCFDVIVCNPPFFKVNKESRLNVSDQRKLARHEITLNLEDIMKISRKLLKNNGVLGIVHRPERLIDILLLMRKNNIEPKKIQFIYPKIGSDANILLIEGRKNGKLGLKILKPLITHNSDGGYTDEIKKYFE